MATAQSPNELTRQQLDELDALLQRMLSLPLNPPETPAPRAPEPPPPALPSVAANWRVDPPAVAAAPAPRMMFTADPLPLPDPIPEPVAVEVEPAVEVERAPLRVAAKPFDEPQPAHDAPEPPPLPPEPPSAVAPPTPWALLPLVAVDRAAGRVLGVLGPVGRVLRSGFGRSLFGVAGVLLIGYTAARVAQVQGWVSLPFPLPWPR